MLYLLFLDSATRSNPLLTHQLDSENRTSRIFSDVCHGTMVQGWWSDIIITLGVTLADGLTILKTFYDLTGDTCCVILLRQFVYTRNFCETVNIRKSFQKENVPSLFELFCLYNLHLRLLIVGRQNAFKYNIVLKKT